MKPPENAKYLLFGGTFVLANKLQFVGDRMVEGLSTKQWFLLRSMSELPQDPPPTITQIARETDTSRQNIAKMLEAMERQGLVTLAGSSLDRRSRSVRITPAGWEQIRQTTDNARSFLDRLYGGIEQKDLEAAGAVLQKMIENLQRMQVQVQTAGGKQREDNDYL